MPLPDRETIKADLISLMRERGAVSSTEAYATLSKTWRLTSKEKAAVRGGRSLYEHEIRWARQELVIEGVIQNTEASGRAIWRLIDSSVRLAPAPSDGLLSRMLEGFLDPSMWFLGEWLPRYEQAVVAVKRALAEERIDDAVDIIWLQQDNSVSNAGQGVLAKREIELHRSYFRSVTRRIARNPSPEMFDEILAEAQRQQSPGRLTKVPRLLIARAFATIAPDQYHTTVDLAKQERVISWFEKHTPFRATVGNWAHRAAELSRYLSGIAELRESTLVRNMFPWFIFSQLASKHGRPAFTPGHRPRALSAAGRDRLEVGAITLRHNLLVETLHARLADEFGRDAVGTEQPSGLGGFVDAVVKYDDKSYGIYEVKVTATASDAIRQALGQLLEYAYREGAWDPEKMFVVGEAPLDAESRQFLARLREQFAIPIQYRRLVVVP